MLTFKKVYIAIDPAIGEESHHDCTAIVAGMVFYEKVAGNYLNKVYILPEFVNKRLGFGDSVQAGIDFHNRIKTTYGIPDYKIQILIEGGGYQKAYYTNFKDVSCIAPRYIEQVLTKGMDKRTRIAAACSYIQNKQVFFPENGLGELINQLVHFGIEKHDDLADAFGMVVNKAMSEKPIVLGVADAALCPNQIKNNEKCFIHGQVIYGSKGEYYRKMQEIEDRKNEFLNSLYRNN